MKKLKKIGVIILSLLILASMLSACGGDNNNNNNNNQNQNVNDENTNNNVNNNRNNNQDQENVDEDQNNNQSDNQEEIKEIDFSETKEYSYWLYATPDNDYYTTYSENPVVQWFNEEYNTVMNFEQPAAGTETNSLNTMIATGDYTDLIDIAYYEGSVQQLHDDGVIIDFRKYLDYMPNLSQMIDENPDFRRNMLTDSGNMLKLPQILTDIEEPWGGLVYRHDILETMTGGNVVFPSGQENPTTIEDWEYMLPLFKQYFEAAGMQDYAPLIIPSTGYFPFGDIMSGFGVMYHYYIENDEVKYFCLEDGMYNYLKKMNEWYEKGYIYQDFAGRTNDLFYLPNTSLTYGYAAGIWFGLEDQLSDKLSMPEQGLEVNIKGIPSPIDAKNGIETAPTSMIKDSNEFSGGTVITSNCEEVERILSSIDVFYSQLGSYKIGYGLTKEESEGISLYEEHLPNGTFSLNENKEPIFTEEYKEIVKIGNGEAFIGNRLPGIKNVDYDVLDESEDDPVVLEAKENWNKYYSQDNEIKKLPYAIYRTEEEDMIYMNNQTSIDDYVNSMIVKFILGTEELNESTWENFKQQQIDYGVQQNIQITQNTYDRYLDR